MIRSLSTRLASMLAGIAVVLASSAGAADSPRGAYCDVATTGDHILVTRPGADEGVIDDVNWFARPVPNPQGDWVIGYAMHDLNYLYNLTTGARVRIPDKSDAVATPDGRYMSVPSMYTPDGYVRFYDNEVLLDHLARGEDADGVPPVFVHEHDGLKQVYYQSLGHVSSEAAGGDRTDTYRMIFSGTQNATGFRMVDYRFTRTGDALSVTPSPPIPLCPEIENDLMTPFVSKDGQYVAAYTSPVAEARYASGASLKVFRIAAVDYAGGRASCEQVADLGFVAGKADFSFDGNSLTFHISNVNYLTVFISGGEVFGPGKNADTLSTDVVVARLTRDENGIIDGVDGLQRLTTADAIGAGNYFPAFLPDGRVFYISHVRPADGELPRFEFNVVDPAQAALIHGGTGGETARSIGKLWAERCSDDYDYAEHELPWIYFSLSAKQCTDLVGEATSGAGNRDALLGACNRLPD